MISKRFEPLRAELIMQQGVRTKVIWVFLRYSKSMTRRIVAADIISYLESCV